LWTCTLDNNIQIKFQILWQTVNNKKIIIIIIILKIKGAKYESVQSFHGICNNSGKLFKHAPNRLLKRLHS